MSPKTLHLNLKIKLKMLNKLNYVNKNIDSIE